MRRREFITLVGGAAVGWPLVARAQQASKIYRIGFLANDPAIPTQPAGQAFLDGLGESRFIEGKNVIIDRRFAQGRLDRYAKLVAELVQHGPDVLVTSSNEATLAAKTVGDNNSHCDDEYLRSHWTRHHREPGTAGRTLPA